MTIPMDYCRCHGTGCDVKEQCARFVDAFHPTGHPLVWTDRYCPDTGTTSEGFIAIRSEQQ